MDSQWVVCLGAGNSQLPLIKKSKLLGYKVIAIDRNKKAPGFKFADKKILESTHDVDKIIKKLKGKLLVGLLARTSGYALFTAAKISNLFKIAGLNHQLANISTSKSALHKFSIANKIKMPKAIEVKKNEKIEKLDFLNEVIIKPDFTITGKKSISKVFVKNSKDISKSLELASQSSMNKNVNIEEFIEGYDCAYLVWIKKGIPSIILSWDELNSFDNKSKLFQYGVSMPSISTFINHSKKIEKIIFNFSKKFPNISALLAFSFRVDKSGIPWLIELHPDLTGDKILDKLAPLSTNLDCFSEIIKLFVNSDSLFIRKNMYIKSRPVALIFKNLHRNIAKEILFKEDNILSLHEKINLIINDDKIKKNYLKCLYQAKIKKNKNLFQ